MLRRHGYSTTVEMLDNEVWNGTTRLRLDTQVPLACLTHIVIVQQQVTVVHQDTGVTLVKAGFGFSTKTKRTAVMLPSSGSRNSFGHSPFIVVERT